MITLAGYKVDVLAHFALQKKKSGGEGGERGERRRVRSMSDVTLSLTCPLSELSSMMLKDKAQDRQ